MKQNTIAYDQIQSTTIHEIFKLVLISVFIASIPGCLFSDRNWTQKIILLVVSVASLAFILFLIHFLNKNSRNNKHSIIAYSVLATCYTLIFALFSIHTYLITAGVILVVFTIIVANTYSYRLFTLQAAVSYLLIILFGIKGTGQTITITGSFYFILAGAYTAVVLVLLRNIKSFYQYDLVNQKQLVKLEKVQQDLLYSYEHDAHCHCLNRVGLIRHLEQRLTTEEDDFHLALLDIDGYKYLMTRLGHNQSELLMKEIISQIEKSLECKEIAKMGSDKILMVIPMNAEHFYVFQTIRRILKSVSTNGMTFSLTGCMGFAAATKNIEATELIHYAETALYNAKEKGKDSFAEYDANYIAQLERQFQIYSNMIDGVRNHEFYNLYQPQVDQRTRKITGFEALVRWNSRTLGHVTPNEFIYVSEYTGVILELGYTIMRNAMKFAYEASYLNPDILVSINISLHQLMDDYFCEKTTQYLKDTKVKARNIAFEVTESIYAENITHVTAILMKIKNIGVSIYLDDFGTGYSSLSYLNMLPIDTLKIDKAFIDSINTNEKSVKLLKNIVQLASSLELICVAEGVEDAAQLDVLNDLGCYSIQGYYYDKPLDENTALRKINAIYPA